ncbi:MAG: hypothetical protein IKU15_01510 [Clostridia bacterium]|nr:hypothetical protein [Clostridia bacterium]
MGLFDWLKKTNNQKANTSSIACNELTLEEKISLSDMIIHISTFINIKVCPNYSLRIYTDRDYKIVIEANFGDLSISRLQEYVNDYEHYCWDGRCLADWQVINEGTNDHKLKYICRGLGNTDIFSKFCNWCGEQNLKYERMGDKYVNIYVN